MVIVIVVAAVIGLTKTKTKSSHYIEERINCGISVAFAIITPVTS
jgi:hypothetical protein